MKITRMTSVAPSPASAPAPQNQKNGLATGSLVLGIISIFINPLLLTSLVGLILGVISIIRTPVQRTKAIIGIVLSVVGAIIGIIVMSILFSALGAAGNAIESSQAEQSAIATNGPETGETTAPTPAADDDADVPAGYTSIGDGLYFKFGSKTKDSFSTTQRYTVIAKNGCSSLFLIEANELDKSGDIVGSTNDSVGSIPKGGKFKGKFLILEDGVQKLKITDATCA